MSSFHSARSNSSSCSDSSYGWREEPMMRLHGRRGESLKLGNSCINIFSQIFHWNRSIGAAGHKYLSPRFHHSGSQVSSGYGTDDSFIQIHGSMEPSMRAGATLCRDNAIEAREGIDPSLEDRHICSDSFSSSRSEFTSIVELRELLGAKQAPFVLQDAIQEKRQPVRMKSSRSLKEQPLQRKRSHRRRNSSSDGDNLSMTAESQLETESTPVVASITSTTPDQCMSTEKHRAQTSVLSSGSDGSAYTHKRRTKVRAPPESMVSLPSKNAIYCEGSENNVDNSMATSFSSCYRNQTSKSNHRRALLMEAASKILEGSNRSRRQLTSARSLFADEYHGKTQSYQGILSLKQRDKVVRALRSHKVKFSEKEDVSDLSCQRAHHHQRSKDKSTNTRRLKGEKRWRIGKDGDGSFNLRRVFASAENDVRLAVSSASVCRATPLRRKPYPLMEREAMELQDEEDASTTAKQEEDEEEGEGHSCITWKGKPLTSSITTVVQGSPDYIHNKNSRKIPTSGVASSMARSGAAEDSDMAEIKGEEVDPKKLCDFSWWEQEMYHHYCQSGVAIAVVSNEEEGEEEQGKEGKAEEQQKTEPKEKEEQDHQLQLHGMDSKIVSPAADEYGSDECVSPEVTRKNSLIPVKLMYEDGNNVDVDAVPLSSTITATSSTYPCAEEFQQSSPVSVLDDAVFEDEEEEEEEEEDDDEGNRDEGEDDSSAMNNHLNCFEEAKQQWLEKVHRFEMLAQMDLSMLMKLASEEDEEVQEEDEEGSFCNAEGGESECLNHTSDISSYTSEKLEFSSSLFEIDEQSQRMRSRKESECSSTEETDYSMEYNYATNSLHSFDAGRDTDRDLYDFQEDQEDFLARSNLEDGGILDLVERFKAGKRMHCNSLMACLLGQEECGDHLKSNFIIHPWPCIHKDILHELGKPAVSSLVNFMDSMLQESLATSPNYGSKSMKNNGVIEDLGIELETTLFTMLLHELLNEITSTGSSNLSQNSMGFCH